MIFFNGSGILRRGAALLVVLALVLTLFAGQARAQETDGTPPTVEISLPAGGVAQPSDNVTATFSESMDTSTVNVNTFTLTKDGDPDPIGASVTPDGDSGTVFTLNPSGELDQGATYTARVEGATDIAGNALDEDPDTEGPQGETLSFRVADIENPTVTLVSPGANTEARNSVLATATADDNVGVARVEFIVDGGTPAETRVEATGSGGSYSAEIDTSGYAHDSDHTVAAQAFDADGNASEISPTSSVRIDREVSLSLGDTPAPDGFFDEVPSLSFTTDTDVAAADRQCRAVRNGTTAGAFATCASPYAPALQTDGGYTYDVRVTDNVGNTTTASRSFTLDRAAPNLTIDSGPDGVTFGPNRTQTWTFSTTDATSGPPEVRCSVVTAGSPASFGPCDTADSHSVTDRPGGSYEFTVRATDGAGNQRSVTRDFTIDATAPTVSLTSPDDGQRVRDSVAAAANAGGMDVARVEFLLDGAVRATDTTAPYSATLDTSTLAHGSQHQVAARATDAVGNAATTATRTVTIDREVSLTFGDTPAEGGFTNAGSVPLSFTTDSDVPASGQVCRVVRDGATPGPFSPCESPYAPALSADDGYTYAVRVTDDLGNTRTLSRSFTLDRTPPTLTLNGPAGGDFGPNTTQTWNFAAGDATSGPPEVECSVVAAGGQPSYGACGATTSHSVTNRPDGSYEFGVRATDKAGNEREVVRTIRIDATAPTATLTGPAAGAKVGKTMTLAATAADDRATPKVEFLVDGELKRTVGTAPYSATLDMALYPDGSHTVAARAVDGVGNVSPLSEVGITLDRQVSLTLGNTPVQGSRTNASSVPLSFTTDSDVPAAGLECRAERGGAPPEPYAPCTSPYAPELIQDGVYIYRVRATDDAGNQRTDSRTFTFDKTPPTLTVNGPNDRVFGPGTRQEWTISAGDATSGLSGVECSVAGVDTSPNYGSCATATSHFAADKPEGSYELRVRATDGAGNVTDVGRTFSIDASPPAVTIHAGLPDNAATNQTSLAWAFSAEAGATFECRVYGVGTTPPAFGPCSEEGRHTAGGLAQGRYTFEVRGLDALGNRLDGPSASRAFTVDRTAPRVSGVTPAVNARNVAPGANVTVTFTERMQLLTLGRANFKLIRSGTSTPVAAAVTFNPATNRATLNPANPLQRETTYRVVITTGARDLANNHLLFPRSWSFRVS